MTHEVVEHGNEMKRCERKCDEEQCMRKKGVTKVIGRMVGRTKNKRKVTEVEGSVLGKEQWPAEERVPGGLSTGMTSQHSGEDYGRE